ncbi:MAG TPA: arylesterase [Acidobacteriota bacterium]|nr:arylesterase [Acidobacteriota bacterium]
MAVFCLGSLWAGPQDREKPLILFLGDSLTAGYGLDPALAFPALIQKKIDQEGWSFEVLNAGLSGETSAGGLRRIKWIMRRQPAVMVLELGANDGLRGVPLHSTRRNLQGIIDQARSANPDMKIVLAGMMVPPNLGPHYTETFQSMFEELAEANGLPLIPFLLEGVAAQPNLNLTDGIHPNAEGHKILAENVWEVLKPLLQEMVDGRTK